MSTRAMQVVCDASAISVFILAMHVAGLDPSSTRALAVAFLLAFGVNLLIAGRGRQ